ncbi:MAG: AAA family ATPase, partial [Clostridiales bacterium]|nr:AAA family ATPase [Clostridiales bacterium]
MKPIKLKIKGLNSFIEEQTIDFLRLTDKGLFGIFGPTGSGKSTILDGITLALYGEISRKSTNFINTNCDALQINYEFQISASEVKKYSVYREFKRDKKTGNSISGKCKIVDISGDEPIILAEKVREVNEKCKEIIGLGIDDFLRTVVLPQGKFSEFLKLEGKSRREMLERLFNLEKYGDDLSNKLGKEISKNRILNNQLIGEMKGYEDISKEKLVEKEKEYNNLVNVYEETNKKYLDIEEQFTEIKEIYDLNVELKEYLNEAKLIKDNEDEIKKCKKKLHLGEGALKVNPFILSLESTREELKSTNNHKEKLIIEIDEIKEKSKKIEESFIKAKDKKENELPILKLREERAKNALEEKKLIDEINIELSKIVKLKNTLNLQKEEFEENLKKVNLNINSINDIIKKNEEEIESLNIDSSIKEGVQQGILLNSQYTEYKNRFDRNNEKRKELINKYNNYKEIINITNEKLIIKTNL